MRITRLTTNGSLGKFSYIQRVNDEPLEFTFYWREKTSAWYMDIRRPGSAPLVLGRKLTPSGFPIIWTNPTEETFQIQVGGKEYDTQEAIDELDIRLFDEF